MKKLLAAVMLLPCLHVMAQKPQTFGTYEPCKNDYLFMGANFASMKNATTHGTEFSYNARLFNQFFMGFYYCYAQGKTDETYGYSIKANLGMFTTTNLGLDVSYRIPNASGSQALVLSCTFGPEFIRLGEKIPFSGIRSGSHTFHIDHRVARNAFYSIRPGLRFYSFNNYVMMGVHYNFLFGTPRFGTTTEFEGFQYILSFRTWSKRKREYRYFY